MRLLNCSLSGFPLVILLFLVGCAARPPVQGNEDDAMALSQYRESRAQLLAGDPLSDIEALRDAYVRTSYYKPYGGPVSNATSDAARLEREGNYKGCLDAILRVEEEGFPMLTVHHFGWACASALGNEEVADKHERMARAIFQAITAPGDGRTKESAWLTLNTDELYLVLAIMQLKPKGQALVHADGRAFDLMTVVPEAGGEEEGRYFDITRQMAYGMKFLDKAE